MVIEYRLAMGSNERLNELAEDLFPRRRGFDSDGGNSFDPGGDNSDEGDDPPWRSGPCKTELKRASL